MRRLFSFFVLRTIKVASRLVYRFRTEWVGEVPAEPWVDFRVVALLNHTSLFEWLFAGAVPNRFLRRIALHALVPAADHTLRRPLVGRFLKLLAPNMIAISREADHTWRAVLDRVDADCMVIILPEGRMKRIDGLDKHGQPMTVRGGIADILRSIPEGRMLVAYSGGLHHIQAPGEVLPKLFKTLRISFESLDIGEYMRGLGFDTEPALFKRRVIEDLERRRDLYCPVGREVW